MGAAPTSVESILKCKWLIDPDSLAPGCYWLSSVWFQLMRRERLTLWLTSLWLNNPGSWFKRPGSCGLTELDVLLKLSWFCKSEATPRHKTWQTTTWTRINRLNVVYGKQSGQILGVRWFERMFRIEESRMRLHGSNSALMSLGYRQRVEQPIGADLSCDWWKLSRVLQLNLNTNSAEGAGTCICA